MCVCVGGCSCHSFPGEVRGQLAAIDYSFHYHVGFRDQALFARLGSKHLQWLSHPPDVA